MSEEYIHVVEKRCMTLPLALFQEIFSVDNAVPKEYQFFSKLQIVIFLCYFYHETREALLDIYAMLKEHNRKIYNISIFNFFNTKHFVTENFYLRLKCKEMIIRLDTRLSFLCYSMIYINMEITNKKGTWTFLTNDSYKSIKNFLVKNNKENLNELKYQKEQVLQWKSFGNRYLQRDKEIVTEVYEKIAKYINKSLSYKRILLPDLRKNQPMLQNINREIEIIKDIESYIENPIDFEREFLKFLCNCIYQIQIDSSDLFALIKIIKNHFNLYIIFMKMFLDLQNKFNITIGQKYTFYHGLNLYSCLQNSSIKNEQYQELYTVAQSIIWNHFVKK